MIVEIHGLKVEVVKKEIVSMIRKWAISAENGSKETMEEAIADQLTYIANRNLTHSLYTLASKINNFRGYGGARHRNLNNTDDYDGVSTFEIDDLEESPEHKKL